MIAGALFALLVAAGAGGADSTIAGPRIDALRVGAGVELPDTTTRVRKKAVQLSEWYNTRLKIHKIASYATLPLFVAEFVAGDKLYNDRLNAPKWARDYHGAMGGAIGGLFAINTVTGGLNWWETRGQTEGRKWRTAHSALMLLADAGFVATGMLACDIGEIQNTGSRRKTHRAVAVGSMSVATLSYLMMLKPIRRD